MKKAIKVITIAAALATVIPVNAAPYTGLEACNSLFYTGAAVHYRHYNDKEFIRQVQEDAVLLQDKLLSPAVQQEWQENYSQLEQTKAFVKFFMSCTLAERKKLKVEKLLLTVTNNLNRRK